jgi:hypothetical protein
MALGVGHHRYSQAVLLPQDGIGVDVHLVEGDAAAAELRGQLLAKVAAAAPIEAQRVSLFQ